MARLFTWETYKFTQMIARSTLGRSIPIDELTVRSALVTSVQDAPSDTFLMVVSDALTGVVAGKKVVSLKGSVVFKPGMLTEATYLSNSVKEVNTTNRRQLLYLEHRFFLTKGGKHNSIETESQVTKSYSSFEDGCLVVPINDVVYMDHQMFKTPNPEVIESTRNGVLGVQYEVPPHLQSPVKFTHPRSQDLTELGEHLSRAMVSNITDNLTPLGQISVIIHSTDDLTYKQNWNVQESRNWAISQTVQRCTFQNIQRVEIIEG